MRYSSITLDVETLISKIKRKSVLIKSEFQRSDVWANDRRKKLIDTIMRDWPIPPIQFVKTSSNENYEILDGKQRTTTILKFMNDEFSIDGNIFPLDDELKELNGLKYSDLKRLSQSEKGLYEKYLNRFLNTNISVYQIDEASSEDIAELFYRFNNPMTLNPVEKRNAFFGVTRSQIKKLSEKFISCGADKKTIGFTNNRGTYEDLLLKVAYTYEMSCHKEKITTEKLINLYRDEYIFEEDTIKNIENVFEKLLDIIKSNGFNNKFSKASMFSIILYFTYNNNQLANSDTIESLIKFVVDKEVDKKISNLKLLFDEKCVVGSTDPHNIYIRQFILKKVANIEKNADDILFLDKDKLLNELEDYKYINEAYSMVKP